MAKNGLRRAARLALLAVLAGLIVVPVSAQEGPHRRVSDLSHFSQSVQIRYWLAHPDQAPEPLRERFAAAGQAVAAAGTQSLAPAAPPTGDRFNLDVTGLPQNEESVTGCVGRDVILGGTNDYRGLLDPQVNFTGWHFSPNGGTSVANEGLLPPVSVQGAATPSGGDPVYAASEDCNLFGGSLNYDPFDPFHNPNGIGVYRSTPARLASCPGGSAPSCWPVRRAVATARPSHFLDKEWIAVGRSGSAGTVVWATYSDFVIDDSAPLGFTSASVRAVRCNADLSDCTAPILISGSDPDIQFSDVTVGPDGRTYVTWSEIKGELEQTAQTFVHKLRIAPPGSTAFGPTRVIAVENMAIPFGGFLHANDWRVATYPKHEVAMVGGQARILVVWDACRSRPLDSICEEPRILLRYSDDDGATWSPRQTLSAGGDNYFPAITRDVTERKLAVAWFTNRFDGLFHNRQDVELVTVNPSTLAVTRRQRVTSTSNESEADPLLGGFFIGDYIEVFAQDGVAYVGYNANYTHMRLLGQGFSIPQQDNYLAIRNL